MAVNLHRHVFEDIDAQVAYYCEHAGLDVAAKFARSVIASANELAEFPRRGPVIDAVCGDTIEARWWRVSGFESFRILYVVSDDRVDVLGVVNATRELAVYFQRLREGS